MDERHQFNFCLEFFTLIFSLSSSSSSTSFCSLFWQFFSLPFAIIAILLLVSALRTHSTSRLATLELGESKKKKRFEWNEMFSFRWCCRRLCWRISNSFFLLAMCIARIYSAQLLNGKVFLCAALNVVFVNSSSANILCICIWMHRIFQS